jgi:membrane protein YqaA with SNARE-associated domain
MLSVEKKPSWVRLALIGIISSVLGGVFGYCIGYFFYSYIGAPLVNFYGIAGEVTKLGQVFKDHVFLTIFLASLSPLPYKVFTLSAGLFSVNLISFIFASFVGRGIRFFVVAYLSNKYGARAKNIIMNNQKVAARSIYFLLAIAVLYVLLRTNGIL